MALVYSERWTSTNQTAKLYWVHSNQIKYTPATEKLKSSAGYLISGRKNFLPPFPGKLSYACGLLFGKESDSQTNNNALSGRYLF